MVSDSECMLARLSMVAGVSPRMSLRLTLIKTKQVYLMPVLRGIVEVLIIHGMIGQ